MQLTIIIPSYNTKELLARCLDAIYATVPTSQLNFEVIVVDNHSTDGSEVMLKTKYPQVQSIFNRENLGYGKSNNLAIKRAKGEYILLLNSDCQVKEQAILELYLWSKDKDLTNQGGDETGKGIFVGCQLLNEDGTLQASCGPFYNLVVVFLMLFAKGDQLGITRYSPEKPRQVDWVSGACLLAKKQTFTDLNGFDESIFMYMEEIDLLYRAKQHGHSVWFYPGASVIHTGAASAKHAKAPVVNIFQGLVFFYQKHKSDWELLVLKRLLRTKAWIVMLVCGIMNIQDVKQLYAKALAALE